MYTFLGVSAGWRPGKTRRSDGRRLKVSGSLRFQPIHCGERPRRCLGVAGTPCRSLTLQKYPSQRHSASSKHVLEASAPEVAEHWHLPEGHDHRHGGFLTPGSQNGTESLDLGRLLRTRPEVAALGVLPAEVVHKRRGAASERATA